MRSPPLFVPGCLGALEASAAVDNHDRLAECEGGTDGATSQRGAGSVPFSGSDLVRIST